MDDLDALLAELEQSSSNPKEDNLLLAQCSSGQTAATAAPEIGGNLNQTLSTSGTHKVQLALSTQHQQAGPENVYSEVPTSQPLISSPPPTAAAQQLDDLLAHLGQMQTKFLAGTEHVGGPPSVEPSHSSTLDSMLGDLTQELQDLGINAVSKGECASCHKVIAGKIITALGKSWHPEHFTCTHCGKEIGSQPFYERGGLAYCEKDYHQLFSPRCAYCAAPILEKVLTAMDLTWHPEHFFCTHCGKVFGEDGFHEKNGKPYCRKDFLAMFSPKCKGCDRPVMDNYLSALHGVWHPECFVCGDCLSNFTSGSFFELDGRPYCELHFHQRQGTVCHGCGRPITGRCISAMGHKFHPEHFICAYCLMQLKKGTFREHGEKTYCQACYSKLFL
ncbi:leupaxin [Alligator mississippiensis]|uniref:Leupaxin n=1 Tax=Alligator mississippiensis TaxID=8496 RepID=A0A151NUZ8_ALLMI|nr:leupaxin [Alligator mississippiensis]XP_019341366.1 leupaxin [Alligator mississippiensis]XP_059578412.1 leupaxin [Alligator mississippiensis]KYO40742.1 leupaxin [Alligator mississippiensis]